MMQEGVKIGKNSFTALALSLSARLSPTQLRPNISMLKNHQQCKKKSLKGLQHKDALARIDKECIWRAQATSTMICMTLKLDNNYSILR